MTRDLSGKRVTVVGGARSGVAAARLLRDRGADVLLTDRAALKPDAVAALEQAGARVESGGHSEGALQADFLVISPGVPSDAALVKTAMERAIPVYAELELGSWFCRTPIVAITGSNGKTTTSYLTGHVFRTAGWGVVVGGNVGYPLSDYVRGEQDADVLVLEVSSFQLDHIDEFRPRVSVLLNITPDHMDRYGGRFERYVESKFRICENQRPDDTFVYNFDDPTVRERLEGTGADERPHRLAFSLESEVSGAFVREGRIVTRINDQEELLMEADELSLRGKHNLRNSLAAAVAARVMEVRSESVRESLASFEGVPHRLEFVREIDGVRYVNDSKATNVNAVWYALESFHEQIVLIAGGRDKGNDYDPLRELVRAKVRTLIAIGESADKVLRELGPEVERSVHADSMEDAVRYARIFSKPGDVVLLSPACASFDMFDGFEHRGDVFRETVMGLE